MSDSGSKNVKTCFVTVGTTKFDRLIELLDHEADRFVTLLKARGISRIVLQIGRGEHKPDKLVAKGRENGVDVAYFDLLPSLQEQVAKADLIISHAGTCDTGLLVLNQMVAAYGAGRS